MSEFEGGPGWEFVSEKYACTICEHEQSFARRAFLARILGPFETLPCMHCKNRTKQTKLEPIPV